MLPLVLVVLFCALLAGTAFAGHLPRTTYIGWVGKSVVAQKDVVYVGSNAWNGKIFSHTQDGTAIGTIGWTYWTHRELCGSTILDNYVHSGYAAYNSSGVFDIGLDSFSSCSGIRYGHVLGNHEFKNVGYADWYKDWTHSETLP